MNLVRTHVQLDAEQHRQLAAEARRRGISVSALLREVLAERYGAPQRRAVDLDKAWAFVGSGDDPATDVSVHHDDYLSGKRQ